MSQPYRRDALVPAPGPVDQTLGEFWVENPWDIVAKGNNLSCFERNRVYLNVEDDADRNFLEISHLTGADSDGDGRCVVAADFRNNGQMDLIVRQSGGGSLLLYENHFPWRHSLQVSLQGQTVAGTKPTSNRQGIGARLIAYVQGKKIVRDMFPHNSYRSQAPNIAHFGLGDATKVDKLVIRWPSGKVQEINDVEVDRLIVVDESRVGKDAIIKSDLYKK